MLARWLARVAVLCLFIAGTVIAVVRLGVVAALSAAGGTLLCMIALSERIWPESTRNAPVVQVRAADSAKATEGVVVQVASAIAGSGSTGGGLSAHSAGRGGMTAIAGFRSDVMDRLRARDYPTARGLASLVAHGVVRSGGTASFGGVGGLRADGIARSSGSATLSGPLAG